MQALSHEYGPGCWCGRDCSTTPTPLREALATALTTLHPSVEFLMVTDEQGTWASTPDEFFDAILAQPSMQAVAEHEAVGRAVARLMACGEAFEVQYDPSVTDLPWCVDIASGTDHREHRDAATLPEAIVAALGPSEGERTDG